MPSGPVDVLIAGGGPAGSATALALARVAPGLKVTIVEPEDARKDATIGEAVPPVIRGLLEELDVLDVFQAAGHAQSYRTLSAWGSGALLANEFMLHTEPVGWRLDRARFDAMLLASAIKRGAARIPSRLVGLARTGDGWKVQLEPPFADQTARIVVDATGRSALASRLAGRRIQRFDHQIAAVVVLDPPARENRPDDGVVVTESCPDGWWYTVGLPGGGRVIAFMTDADTAHDIGLRHAAAFRGALVATRHIAGLAARHRAPLCDKPRLVAAGSARIALAAGQDMIAVGDAAMAFDPIASLGIVKALRSGLFAAYAITDSLVGGDPGGFTRYAMLAQREYNSYSRRHAEVYRQEARWPASRYWARRLEQPA